MSEFKIVNTIVSSIDPWFAEDETIVAEESSWEDAVVMAELLAETDAARLGLEWLRSGNGVENTGGMFETGKSVVFYTAKRSSV